MIYNMVRIKLILFLIVGSSFSFVACSEPEEEGTIRIGQITNRTGETSDVGIPLADGVRDAWRWINEEGGIRGQPVRIIERETGYNVPRTIAAFRELTGDYNVQLIHGFGTPDSEAVMDLATRAEVIYMPTSYDERFVNPELAPYFFITNTDYSTAARSAVRYVAEQDGRLGLARNPGGFGMAPIACYQRRSCCRWSTYRFRTGFELYADICSSTGTGISKCRSYSHLDGEYTYCNGSIDA
jgi:branched-chain amino acid transport system substrate-binding protein